VSDSPAITWVRTLGSAGVIALLGRILEGGFRWFVRRPLERAEHDAEFWRSQYTAVASELKATTGAMLDLQRADAIAHGAPADSLPPPRPELPTLTCMVEGPSVRAWAAERAAAPVPAPTIRRGPPPPPVRVIETYSPTARPTPTAPRGYPDQPVSLAPLFPPPPRLPTGAPRPPRPRSRS
jgi:hypothetical protein